MLAIFWYPIDKLYIWKSLVVGVERVLVVGKSGVSGSKSWAMGKISIVDRGWFSVILSSTR